MLPAARPLCIDEIQAAILIVAHAWDWFAFRPVLFERRAGANSAPASDAAFTKGIGSSPHDLPSNADQPRLAGLLPGVHGLSRGPRPGADR